MKLDQTPREISGAMTMINSKQMEAEGNCTY